MADLQSAQVVPFEVQEITAVNTDVGVEVFYFGSEEYADVVVSAAGDITFAHGASVGTKAADSEVGLPTRNGIYDVSDATTDTFVEFLRDINASRNWRVRLVGFRAADLANNTLDTRTAAQCNISPVLLLKDSGVSPQLTTFHSAIRITAASVNGASGTAWINKITEIYAVGTCTVGTAVGYNDGEGALFGLRVVVYAINPVTGTQRRIWHSSAMSTTVAATFPDGTPGSSDDWGGLPLAGNPGEDLLVLLQNSGTSATAVTSPTLRVKGYRELASVGRGSRFFQSNI